MYMFGVKVGGVNLEISAVYYNKWQLMPFFGEGFMEDAYEQQNKQLLSQLQYIHMQYKISSDFFLPQKTNFAI